MVSWCKNGPKCTYILKIRAAGRLGCTFGDKQRRETTSDRTAWHHQNDIHMANNTRQQQEICTASDAASVYVRRRG